MLLWCVPHLSMLASYWNLQKDVDSLERVRMDEGFPFHEHLLLKLNTDKQDGFILGVFTEALLVHQKMTKICLV